MTFTSEQLALSESAARRLWPEMVRHNGQGYLFDGPCKPVAVLVEDVGGPRQIDAVYECTGSHHGPPLRLVIVNVAREWDGDDDGHAICSIAYDCFAWVDDRTVCDVDYVLDAYADAIREDVREWIWRD